MKKLQHLYEFLLAELPGISKRKDSLHVFAEEGTVTSHEGDANQNFKQNYSAVILLDRSTLSANLVAHVLLRWMSVNQTTQASNKPLTWYAEITKPGEADIVFNIAIDEWVHPAEIEGVVHLNQTKEVCHGQLDGDVTSITIEHDPDGNNA